MTGRPHRRNKPMKVRGFGRAQNPKDYYEQAGINPDGSKKQKFVKCGCTADGKPNKETCYRWSFAIVRELGLSVDFSENGTCSEQCSYLRHPMNKEKF